MVLTVSLSLLCVHVGDIVQLGSTTVFRFNHPQEAAEMKDGSNEASPNNASTCLFCRGCLALIYCLSVC